MADNMKNDLAAVPIIYDGDMGGDDIWAIMMMLAYPDKFDVKGITTVFGNVDQPKATQNILSLLSYCNITDIPVYAGAQKPLQGSCIFGDNAYGDDGIGGVCLPKGAELKAQAKGATDFIIETLLTSEQPVTIFATGPTTNICHALNKNPAIKDKIERVIVMGGALRPGPTPSPAERIGNITLAAEFNFFQDPYAAHALLNSGLRIDLLTMDANQNIHLDPKTKVQIQEILPEKFGEYAVKFLAPAEALDRPKFGVAGPFIHDPNVVIFALHPEFYIGQRATVQVLSASDQDYMHSNHGQLIADFSRAESPCQVITGMKMPANVLGTMVHALERFANRTLG